MDEPYDFRELILSQLQLLESFQPNGTGLIWPCTFKVELSWQWRRAARSPAPHSRMISALLGLQCWDSSPERIHPHSCVWVQPPPLLTSVSPFTFTADGSLSRESINHLLVALPRPTPESVLSVSYVSTTSSSSLDSFIPWLCHWVGLQSRWPH